MSKGALINIQVALVCLGGSFQRLHHSQMEHIYLGNTAWLYTPHPTVSTLNPPRPVLSPHTPSPQCHERHSM